VGPMRAARRFAVGLRDAGLLGRVARVKAELYGSLALTGVGHATDKAVLLGLTGEKPEEVDPAQIDAIVSEIRDMKRLCVLHEREVRFEETRDLLFHNDQVLPQHPNGMRFSAFHDGGELLASEAYFSIGGGFVLKEGETEGDAAPLPVPHPFSNAAELLEQAESKGLPVWKLMLENESALRDSLNRAQRPPGGLCAEAEVRERIARIWEVMDACIERGLHTTGILPGGLNVRRRAPGLYAKVRQESKSDPLRAMDAVNAFAMAVNEENASGGRVVTAPTNGAAGLLPAVARYYRDLLPDSSQEGLTRLFLTAGAIGILYKENASISGAEVGCQGEVGVACSMAAGGLAGALGAGNAEVEHAAEIAMEHNLGMTCDPIGGLVQIPCIERNAIGAVKAINACRMAMQETGGHKVSLDDVIRTMYQTGLDMQSRYKETALAGLAVNVKEC
jgi:L-serine dehydratase